MASILIVDDDSILSSTLEQLLTRNGHKVKTTATPQEAEDTLKEMMFDLVITDLCLPGGSGLDIIARVKATMPETEVVMITGHGSIDSAVQALKQGAADYITKPFKDDEMLMVVEKIINQSELRTELKHLKRAFAEDFSLDNIVGSSAAIRKIANIVRQIAPQDINVLISGESGVGKELFAKAIHNNSSRRDSKFVAINCSAMPDLLLESELFGHVKGAFTSATANKKGLFEEADGGTIFLDEVGDTSPSLQAKLLRVLQEEEIRPVGANQTSKINVRIVAATNKNLEQMVTEGRFREDLYYRLNVISIDIPSIKQRREDIVPLTYHFLRKYCKHFNKPDKTLTQSACNKLVSHDWPGNVRELENTIKRAVALSIAEVIDVENLFLMTPLQRHVSVSEPQLSRLRDASLEDIQRDHIIQSLRENKWNYSVTAAKLGIGRTTLWRKVKKYDLTKETS